MRKFELMSWQGNSKFHRSIIDMLPELGVTEKENPLQFDGRRRAEKIRRSALQVAERALPRREAASFRGGGRARAAKNPRGHEPSRERCPGRRKIGSDSGVA